MAKISITQFGGLSPSVDPRRLAEDGAQTAVNLDLRHGDFRPTRGPGASVATVPAGTTSIFRTPSGVWLSSPTDTDYVNGQIADAATERVYLTGRSAFPEVWQSGGYRRLGVPSPANRPTVKVLATDELTESDANAAQIAATNAVLAAVNSLITRPLLGNPAPSGVAPPVLTPDPLFSRVALLLHLDALDGGGRFVDSGPQGRLISTEAGVSFQAGSSGPLGAAGAGHAVLAGAGGITFSGITRYRDAADPTWTIEAWVTADVDMPEIGIEAYGGNMRKVLLYPVAGRQRTLFGSVHDNFSLQLRCRRANGASVCPAGVPVFLAIQCTSEAVEVYVDGVLAGRTPNKESLELDMIGRASNRSDEAWTGKLDEVRVTLAQRYTSNFTRPVAPFSSGAVPTGFWVAHGDPAAEGLPTVSSVDAAYLIQLTLSGGSYVATNPADDYLRTGSLSGAQVTYSGAQYWAVPVRDFRALGKLVDPVPLAAALAAVDNPAAPGTPLLTGPQATALAASIYAACNASIAPVLTQVTALNTQQADLKAQLATPTDAAALATKISLTQAAARALRDYFADFDSVIKVILSDEASNLFGSITDKIVTRVLETRGYIVTYLTDRDEESAPSAPSELIELDQNDGAKVEAPAPPAGRNIIGWRLYRSSTTNAGAAFQLVDGTGAPNALLIDGKDFRCFDIGNLTFTDSKEQGELQELCPTLTWAEPPENLRGLVGLPNGIMAGFFGKTLCFSEPGFPHAWPEEYRVPLEYSVVGIGVFGQTAVALTQGCPYFVSGADSASMSAQKVESPQACIAKRTIAPVEGGVIYASPDGLCLASPTGVQVLTQGAFSRDDWQQLIGAGAFGAFHDGRYFLFTA